jgi:hypothetical protein
MQKDTKRKTGCESSQDWHPDKADYLAKLRLLHDEPISIG